MASDWLLQQKFGSDTRASQRTALVTNHSSDLSQINDNLLVTIFLTDEQQKLWNMKRIDIRGPPGSGKSLLIMLKILERSSAAKDSKHQPILVFVKSAAMIEMYKAFLNSNNIPFVIVNSETPIEKLQKLLVENSKETVGTCRPVALLTYDNVDALFCALKISDLNQFDSLFADEMVPLDYLINKEDNYQSANEKKLQALIGNEYAEILWISYSTNSTYRNDEGCDKTSKECKLVTFDLKKVMRYTVNEYELLTKLLPNVFKESICGHRVQNSDYSCEYEIPVTQIADKVLELIEANKIRWVGEKNKENSEHWERLAILVDSDYPNKIDQNIRIRLESKNIPCTSYFGELEKLVVTWAPYTIEWPIAICIVDRKSAQDRTPISLSRASTERHILWVEFPPGYY